jgi:hypothetical protein
MAALTTHLPTVTRTRAGQDAARLTPIGAAALSHLASWRSSGAASHVSGDKPLLSTVVVFIKITFPFLTLFFDAFH